MKCKIDGCEKSVLGRGWCGAHYAKWRKYGAPDAVVQVQHHGLSLRERLLKWCSTGDGCWEWKGATNTKGYGQLGMNGVPRLAHRLSWEAFKGSLPKNAFVLHRCDNPLCINPAHLFLGDQAANMADKMAKKRHRFGVSRGENHGCAKLTEDDVRAIRASAGPSNDVGDKFGISGRQVRDIRTRKAWSHLK